MFDLTLSYHLFFCTYFRRTNTRFHMWLAPSGINWVSQTLVFLYTWSLARGLFIGDERKMAASITSKFDPADNPAFGEFIDSFKYEYEAIAKAPPAGTADSAGWKQLDKRRQLLGKFSSRNFQRDFEDETTAALINFQMYQNIDPKNNKATLTWTSVFNHWLSEKE